MKISTLSLSLSLALGSLSRRSFLNIFEVEETGNFLLAHTHILRMLFGCIFLIYTPYTRRVIIVIIKLESVVIYFEDTHTHTHTAEQRAGGARGDDGGFFFEFLSQKIKKESFMR